MAPPTNVSKKLFESSPDKLTRFLMWLVGVTASVVTAYAVLKGAVTDNTNKVDDARDRVSRIEKRVTVTEIFVAEQRVQNEWMRGALTEIKAAVKDNRDDRRGE